MQLSACLTCGISIEGLRSTKKYCSRKCLPSRLPITEEQKAKARKRNQRYWANLPKSAQLARTRRDNAHAKIKGWPNQLKFRQNHPEVIKATNSFRAALHRGSKGNKVMIATLLERNGEWCGLCGLPLNEDITVDHIKPVTSGGLHETQNLTLAHMKCNQSKYNKPFITWALGVNNG